MSLIWLSFYRWLQILKVLPEMSRLLKTIRFDDTDDNVFDHAAIEHEWAISCAFQFCDRQWDELDGKPRQAFNNGFLGLASFGYSTFGITSKISSSEIGEAELVLAKHIFETYGAPDLQAAMGAAKQEIEFTAELCDDVPVGTVFSVTREFTVDGRITESFRKVELDENHIQHGKIWEIVDE